MSLFEELIKKCGRGELNRLGELNSLVSFNVIKLDDVYKCAMNTDSAEVLYYILDLFKSNSNEFKTIKKRLLATGNSEYIYYMVTKYVKDFTVREIKECAEALIVEGENVFASGDYITRFALDIPDASLDILVDAIISLNRGIDVYNFAKNVTATKPGLLDEEALNKLTDVICKTLDAKLIYNFAKDVSGSNKEKLSLAMADTLNQDYIYFFARDIIGSYKEKLTEAFIKTLYITKKNNHVVDYCINMNVVFIDDLIKLKDYEDIYELALYIIDENLLKKIIDYFRNGGYNNLIYNLALKREHIRKFLLKTYGDTYSDMIKKIEAQRLEQRKKNEEVKQINRNEYSIPNLSQEGLKQVLYKLIKEQQYGEIKANRMYFSPFLTYNEDLNVNNGLKREIKKLK